MAYSNSIGANYQNARMAGTNLTFATLVRANLRFVDFTSARLFDANLCGMLALPMIS
jgi:uncharacterized protein YjbI with pentapeptide repeats